MTTPPTILSIESADSLLPLRRTRAICFFILLLVLLGQMTMFFLEKYNVTNMTPDPTPVGVVMGSAMGSEMGIEPLPALAEGSKDMLNIHATPGSAASRPTTRVASAVNATTGANATPELIRGPAVDLAYDPSPALLATSLAVAAAGLLPLILLGLSVITLMVQVSGRLMGQSRTAAAIGWWLLAVVLLIPWQAVLTRQMLCGAAWTWPELVHAMRHPPQDIFAQIVHWGRFVALPLLALIVAIIAHLKTSAGVKLALGEADLDVDALPPEA